jgi:DNA-binding transcriptional regulator YiaG
MPAEAAVGKADFSAATGEAPMMSPMLNNVREQIESVEYFSQKASPMVMDFDPSKLVAIDLHIGRRIRMRRRQLGLNQSELARRIGVTFQQVHKYETGQSAVTAARLFAIATALGSPLEYFYDDILL